MLLIGGFALFFLLAANSPALAFSTNDAGTMFSAYNSAFYLQNGTNGIFKNSQTDASAAYFWGQAETIECVIDAYEWNSNATAQVMITNLLNGFLQNNGANWTWDGYNDDILWAVMAFARGGVDTGMTTIAILRRQILTRSMRGPGTRVWGAACIGNIPKMPLKMPVLTVPEPLPPVCCIRFMAIPII